MVSRSEIESYPFNTIEMQDTIVTTCLNNLFNLHMDPKDKSLTPSISTHGYWESWITAYIMNNVQGKHFLDLGANSGYYSLLAAKLGAESVTAFEPNPKYVRLLHKNRWENRVNINVVDKAVGDKIGPVALNFYGDLDGSATIVSPTESHIRALSTTLDRYMFMEPMDAPVLMKVDVEGAEEKVFDGAQRFLNDNQVTMVMEYTPGAYSDEFWDKLSHWGSVNVLDHNGRPQAITERMANSNKDWITLVIRNN
jgi:FkbM family methyltransferase